MYGVQNWLKTKNLASLTSFRSTAASRSRRGVLPGAIAQACVSYFGVSTYLVLIETYHITLLVVLKQPN